MGFSRVVPPMKYIPGQGTGIKASVRIGKVSGNPNVILTIAKHIWGKLDLNLSNKWGVCEGEDEDRGKLRVAPEADGDFSPGKTNKGEALVFYLGELKCAPLKRMEPRWCQFEIQNNCLVISLPSWSLPTVEVPTVFGSKPIVQGRADMSGRVVSMGEPTDEFKRARAEADAASKALLSPKQKQNPAARKSRDFSFTRSEKA